MSHHEAKPSKLLKKRVSVRTRTIFIPAILVALVVIAINAKRPIFFGVDREDWPSVRGEVVSTRISVVGTYDSKYPGGIHYQAEAKVIYQQDGEQHDSWLPASRVFNSKEELEFWLSLKDSDKCSVRWNPRNPSDIEAVLESRSKKNG
jgi:Protein of unknown function (DUF3592)